MPRKLLERTNVLPYHVTARSNNREDFSLKPERLWEIMALECLNLHLVYEAEIHAFVLMPNHFHLLMTVPKYDLGRLMNVFISSVTRTANLISGRSGHIFGGPYYWSLIQSSRYYGHALKYVYRNPVRAQLCAQVERYPYSSLHGLLGFSHLPFPLHLTRVGMELALPTVDPLEQLEWLNRPFPIEAETLIQKGLRKKVFDSLINRNIRRPESQLDQLI